MPDRQRPDTRRGQPAPKAARCARALAILFLALTGQASAQALDRYFPANVPAYQDWIAAASPVQEDGVAQPQGVRLGNVIVRPEAAEQAGYDSNPFLGGAQGGTAVVNSQASINADTDWTRDALDARISVDDTRFLAFPHRSFTDWTAAFGAKLDYADDRIEFGYAHLNTVTLPTSVAAFGIQSAITDQVDDLRLSDTIGTGRLQLVPQIVGQIYRFDAAPGSGSLAGDGTFNRDAATASLTASFSFAGGHNLLAILSDSAVEYLGGAAGLRPANYNDVSFLAGVEYRQSAIFAYRLLAGYENRAATGRGLVAGTITSPAAELDLIYKPTVLTTLTFTLSRSLQNEPTGLAQGLAEVSAKLAVDHSLSRKVMLRAAAEYVRADFPGNGPTQSSTEVDLSAVWRLARNVTLSAEYHLVHTSGGAQTGGGETGSGGFTRHQALLGVRFDI
jgi:hypothetical protein